MSEKGRVEAFSDGVFAIAITLLVLEIHVPAIRGGTVALARAGRGWPSYFAYVVGFLGHRRDVAQPPHVFGYIAHVNRLLLA